MTNQDISQMREMNSRKRFLASIILVIVVVATGVYSLLLYFVPVVSPYPPCVDFHCGYVSTLRLNFPLTDMAYDNISGNVVFAGGDQFIAMDPATDSLVQDIQLPGALCSGFLTLPIDWKSGTIFVPAPCGEVTLINATTGRVKSEISLNMTTANQSLIGDMAFDPQTNDLYLVGGSQPPTSGGNVSINITVVNTIDAKVVRVITLSGDGGGITFDPQTGDLYVSETDQLVVINGSTNFVDGTIRGNMSVGAVAYDHSDGDLFVSGPSMECPLCTATNVSVISPKSSSLIRSVPIGGQVEAFAEDPAQGLLFISVYSPYDSGLIAVVSSSSYALLASINCYDSPDNLAFDGGDGILYGSVNMTGTIEVVSRTAPPEPLLIVVGMVLIGAMVPFLLVAIRNRKYDLSLVPESLDHGLLIPKESEDPTFHR